MLMNKQEIRNHILKTEWENWHKTGHFARLFGSVFPYDVSGQEADNIMEVVRELIDEGYYRDEYGGELTRKGIVYTEEQNLVDAEKVLYHRELRHKILSFLYQLHESKGRSEIHITQLAAELNVDMDKLDEDYRVLFALGYVKEPNPLISREGIEYWQEQLLLESFKNEFSDLENLKGLTPQKRGLALQRLLAKVIGFAGFPAEEGVRRSHEEIDVIFEYKENYYLIECKWVKKKTEAPIIRELYGKIENRSEMRGVCVSVAGFTGGAEKQVIEYANKRIRVMPSRKVKYNT